ncbi:AhpD-like protein [Trichoderma camerunense]
MNRLGLIEPDKLAAEQKPLYETLSECSTNIPFVTKNPTGELVGAFALLLHNPPFGELWFKLDRAVTSLPLPLTVREVAILVVASRAKCAYELYAHTVMAEIRGISKEQVEDLINGKFPESLGEEEKVAWDVANAMGKPGPLVQSLWDSGVKRIGRDNMMSLIHVIGFYQYISIILNGFDVQVPQDN